MRSRFPLVHPRTAFLMQLWRAGVLSAAGVIPAEEGYLSWSYFCPPGRALAPADPPAGRAVGGCRPALAEACPLPAGRELGWEPGRERAVSREALGWLLPAGRRQRPMGAGCGWDLFSRSWMETSDESHAFPQHPKAWSCWLL